jgi:hypothetical protein
MGGDGEALAQISRAVAGTALIDCSGSMRLTRPPFGRLCRSCRLRKSGYTQAFQRTAKGAGSASSRSGRLGELSLVSPKFGACNVFDGPVLRWLASRRGPRFWISDGAVNGCEGQQSKALFLDVLDTVQRFKIQRLDSVSALLDRA